MPLVSLDCGHWGGPPLGRSAARMLGLPGPPGPPGPLREILYGERQVARALIPDCIFYTLVDGAAQDLIDGLKELIGEASLSADLGLRRRRSEPRFAWNATVRSSLLASIDELNILQQHHRTPPSKLQPSKTIMVSSIRPELLQSAISSYCYGKKDHLNVIYIFFPSSLP
jgi:hypothetical protein